MTDEWIPPKYEPIPNALEEALNHQRLGKIIDLLNRAVEIGKRIGKPPVDDEDVIDFERDGPLWPVALKLGDPGRTGGGISSLRLRCYPSKSPGFWRVEYRLDPSNRGLYTGGEFYIAHEQVLEAFRVTDQPEQS
jgi:hypothetical protein